MKVHRLLVKDLNKHTGQIDDLHFDNELTILTAKNGYGKTTLLKLLWYLISPNVERAFEDIKFTYAEIETSLYSMVIYNNSERREVVFNRKGNKTIVKLDDESRRDEHFLTYYRSNFGLVEKINDQIRKLREQSLYFPTFRRFEENPSEARGIFSSVARELDLASAKISVDGYKFISSISTIDVEGLILTKYSQLSDKALDKRAVLLQKITDYIAQNKSASSETTLKKIVDAINKSEIEQNELFASWNTFNESVIHFIPDKTIKIANSIKIGEEQHKRTVDASHLSAGEKQVLGFLAYNAFYQNIPIIIDEPELSLHVDWQRNILPALLNQNTHNQIIVATHSPFIYARYPRNEIMLGETPNE